MNLRYDITSLIDPKQNYWFLYVFNFLLAVRIEWWLLSSLILDEIPEAMTFSSVQSLNRVRLFASPWIAARQASLPITNTQSSLKLVFIESVMPSSHLILCLLMDIYVASISWQSQMLLWTLRCMCTFCNVCFFSYIYPEVELLGHMVVQFFNFLRNYHSIFHNGYTNSHSHQQVCKDFLFQHPCEHLLSLIFLTIGVR